MSESLEERFISFFPKKFQGVNDEKRKDRNARRKIANAKRKGRPEGRSGSRNAADW